MSKTDKELNDLEARLRAEIDNGKEAAFPVNSDGPAAADAIAELRKTNAGLEKALKALESAVADYTDAETQTVIFSAAERRKAIEENTQ